MATHVMPCHGAAVSSANVSNLWFRNRHAAILEALDAPLEILPPFVLCAEPGAGKTCLLDLLVNHWSSKGRPVSAITFLGWNHLGLLIGSMQFPDIFTLRDWQVCS